uniref:Uncharacterized protein n=1 Tax=Plectus sambesii TaxID=2011161 RepID=A0A914W5U1_9BILA
MFVLLRDGDQGRCAVETIATADLLRKCRPPTHSAACPPPDAPADRTCHPSLSTSGRSCPSICPTSQPRGRVVSRRVAPCRALSVRPHDPPFKSPATLRQSIAHFEYRR